MAGGGDGAGVMGERIPVNAATDDETWLLAAVEGSGSADTGAQVVSTLRNALSTDPGSDTGAAVKQAFRQANAALYQSGQGSQVASAVALYAQGKYATIASIGTGRAYLVRAGRLNQVTRDPISIQSKAARNDPTTEKPTVALLGARERLDTRQPAIYEITLLPEDRLLLCTAEVFGHANEASMLANLAGGDVNASASSLVPVGELAHERRIAFRRQSELLGEDGMVMVLAEKLPKAGEIVPFQIVPIAPVSYDTTPVLRDLERARFYVRRINAVPEQVTAQSLWLAARVERRLGNGEALADLGRQLRDRFPQSTEALQFERGQFDE